MWSCILKRHGGQKSCFQLCRSAIFSIFPGAVHSLAHPIFFFYKIPWSSNFLTKTRGWCPVASWGKPPASYSEYTSRAQHVSQLHDKFQASGRLRGAPAPAAICQSEQCLAWAITAEASGKPEQESPRGFPPSPNTWRNHTVLSGHLCRSAVLAGQMRKEVTAVSKLQKSLRGGCPLVIPCALKSPTKGIHSPSTSPPVLPASESLLSVMWILFTSLISSCHQLMNKLFMSKFINYPTSSIDDWIILTK